MKCILSLLVACGLAALSFSADAETQDNYEYAVLSIPLEKSICDHPPCVLPGMTRAYQKVMQESWQIIAVSDNGVGASVLFVRRLRGASVR